MDWTLVDSQNVEGNPVVTLELKDAPYSRAMWDFSFHALYKVKALFSLPGLHLRNTTTLHYLYSFLSTYMMMQFHASFLQVTLDTRSLSTELKVKNTDNKEFSFSTALHTYFRVSDTGHHFE